MRKIVAVLLIVVMSFSVVACGIAVSAHAVAKAEKPMDVNSYNDYYKDDDYRAFVAKIADFSARLSASAVKKYGQSENIVISPLSVYMALALACESTTGETRQEILDAVGVTYDEVNQFTKKLYGFANVDYTQLNLVGIEQSVARQELFNSIWLDNDVEFINTGVQKLASEYNCDVYQASFKNGQAKRLINQYIETKSHGLLDGDVDFSPETYFVLMNTYYLKEIWNEYGDHLSLTSDIYRFWNTDGSYEDTKLLMGYYSSGKAYDGDNFTSFFTTTDHGMRIYFFLPDEEWSVDSIFTEENISTILTLKDWGAVDDENRLLHNTRVFFPEYDVDFSEDIADVLKNDFGIKKLFNPLDCDASTISVEPVYCEGVIHKAALKVDKTGIEGAAATVLPMCGSAGPGEYEPIYHDFVVDRAFGLVLVDSYGTVLFSGVVNILE